MAIIKKAKETMTSRERVVKTFNYEKTDRVPINYMTNEVIHGKLAKALGLDPRDSDSINDALGVDIRMIHPDYKGPLIFKELPGRNVDPVYGFYSKWIENEAGGYHDFVDFPLAGASDEEIYAYTFPSADDFDYDGALEKMHSYEDYGLSCGHAGMPDIINATGRIMNMENTLIGLVTRDEAVLDLVDRKLSLELGILERLLDKAGGRIDFVWLGEDLGTQHAPMISPDLFADVFRPRLQRFVDLAKAYKLPVMIHTCGSSSWAYEDFIEMGIGAVDTLQPEAANMSPEYLVEHFGGRLAFQGFISTAGPLAYGTAEETREYCRKTLEFMKKNRGYFFCPTHQIQDNSPVENVIAMYQAAHTYGIYD